MAKLTVKDVELKGKKVLVRVDFNVPVKDGVITNDNRITAALPTIKYILEQGGRAILFSHLGRVKEEADKEGKSLAPVAADLAAKLGQDVKFIPGVTRGAELEAAVNALEDGQVLLVENTRFEDVDGKKESKNDPELGKYWASLGDGIFVNDAFGTAHRKHASTAVIADYFDADHKMLGYLMEKEVQAVDNVLSNIKRPFTAIMGGSKVSTKIGIIENLMDKVDNLILCGGMTYTFAKAQGGKIGMSICEDDKLDLALDIIAKAKAKGVNLVLGTDCVAADAFSNDANTQICPANDVPEGWEGLDAGPETRKAFADAIKGAKTILWNGPAGVFEFDNFTAGSRAIAEAIAEATANGAFSLIGGGDSVACINKFGMADKVSYISTGGGALLEAIEGKILPGIAAIKGE
mgnify:CR=1 FL=1